MAGGRCPWLTTPPLSIVPAPPPAPPGLSWIMQLKLNKPNKTQKLLRLGPAVDCILSIETLHFYNVLIIMNLNQYSQL